MPSEGYVRFALANRRFLAFGFLMALGSSFGQTYFIGVFGPGLRAEFGLSHGDWGLVFMAGTLASAAVLPWTGRLIDRLDLRVFTAAAFVGLAAACFLTAIAGHVAVLVIAIFGLRQFGQGLMTHTSGASMVRYFDANRGKAISLASVGFSAGQTVLPFAAVAVIAVAGWRSTYAAMGVFLLVAALPVALWLLKGHGERHRRHLDVLARPASDNAVGRQWTAAEVLRDPRFYVLLVGIEAPAFIGTALFFHHLHLADVKGWSHAWITGNYIVHAAAVLATMLVAGRLVDRLGALRLVPLHLLPLGFGLVVVATFDAAPWASLYLFAMGVTLGLAFTSVGALWAEMYGVRHIGAIKSLVSSALVFASALGPLFMGALIDAGVAMEDICLIFAAYVIVGTAAIWAALRNVARR
ncbi:MAG: MFS transporter, partial [Rhodospirillales bacterium]|nr:MFS transporter [Rhodospirillales bacterium]